ncbi:nonribosomal peptide synthase [Colletotrichum kahawae]|uniref:Nonribosomal peptide synthase n=1 Tax=Colletotrichum kahawae TaxID=34407 RepID=A0AAE0D765_COLKA|nr:nonribosomal peptide synthase [Colletotrichum kahawae]
MSATAILEAVPGDPFSSIPAPQEGWHAVKIMAQGDSTSKYTLEATQVQRDILQEPIQWATAELPLPEPLPSFQAIENAWNTLASYHACLRAHPYVDTQADSVFVRVLRRIENIVPAVWADATTEDALAHVVWQPKTEKGKYKVILKFRRAIVDATSVDIIKTDFLLIISGLPPLDRLSFTFYNNFVQRNKKPNESAAFWHEMLATADLSSALSMPLSPGYVEAKERRYLRFQRSEASLPLFNMVPKGVARKTLFEIVWALVLSYHSNSQDVVFGVVGRDDSFVGAESTVGCLDQTYLLRVMIPTQSSVADVAQTVGNFALRAAKHAFIGLPAILQHLPRGQMVESVLNFTSGYTCSCLASGLRKFPMVMSVSDTNQPMLTMSYVSDITDSDAQTILDHYSNAIIDALAKTNVFESLLQDLRLVSDAETSFLLAAPPVAAIENPPTLSELIEISALSHSSRVAVVFEDQDSLSYEELNNAANGLGSYLKLSKGGVVPLLMDRSANLCIAILALLKSGVTYNILNPEMPQERNAQIIQECSPNLILADISYSHMFPSTRSIEDVLAEAAAFSRPDNSWNADCRPTPDDASYIIYTSGSTGKPKGTVITNRAAANGILQHPPLEDMPRVLLFYSPTSSAAQRTFVSTLVHGGTIVLASKESIFTDLAGVINRYEVDAMEITPTALNLLQPSRIPNIKQITIAGENMPQALVDAWAANSSLIVRNRYGSSECTQMSLGRRLRPKDNPRNLGAPADTTMTYILQPELDKLVALGVAGELCLSGPQLASGYLNEPGLTENAFVRNPFCKDESYNRMYRTGDRARKLPDGSIEIMGRIDWQVKINGNKVEPAEVDHTIARHQRVAACVTFGAEVGGNLTLVAAVVPKDGEQQWSELLPILRRHALDTLPTFMADLKTLRTLSTELGVHGFSALATSGSREGRLITNVVERRIADAWASALGIQQDVIDQDQSFIALGGNSLQAIRVISMLRDQGLVVDFRSLLTDMPLHEVAMLARESTADRSHATKPFSLIDNAPFVEELKTDMDVVDAYPATPLQSALLSTLNDHYIYRRAWDVSGLDIEKLKDSFCRVFELSDILRTGFVPHTHSFVQFVRADVSLPWVESDLALEEYTAWDSKIDLPLSGPLFRVGIVQNKWLVVTTHHSLCDFWSHNFLYQDVSAAYNGKTIPIRPRFAIRYLSGVHKSQLNDPQHNDLNIKTGSISTEVDLDLYGQAKLLGVAVGAVVSAAWAMVLSRHQDSHDVVFATTLSGRDTPVPGIESMDGPALATVPQRVTIIPEKSLISLVKDVCTPNLVDINQHACVGMQGALKAASLPTDSFDTLINILPNDESSETDANIFKRHGERPIWRTPYTVLEVIPDGARTVIRMSGDIDSRRIQFLCDSFIKAATAILKTRGQLVSDVDIMGDAEHIFLRNTLSNRDRLVTPVPQLLQADFEKCALTEPNRVAIDWTGTVQISYASLNGRANHVAAILIHHGLRPGDCVALMLEKSIEALVCIFGILKAGCTYLPLSPDNPVERNVFICQETSARLIILQGEKREFALHVTGLQALLVDYIPPLEAEAPIVDVAPQHHAYIIYTSGSTGQPKGIMVPHRTAAVAVKSMCAVERRFEGEWRVLQLSNYVFDASIMDIFNTLSTGGTLCMAPTAELLSDLTGCIRRMDVHQAALTPTVAGLLQASEVPCLQTLVLMGESVPRRVLDQWTPYCRVLNSYGPTETSIVACTKEVECGGLGPAGNIGPPYASVMAFVLDAEGSSLRHHGAIGELCLAGPQVTDGYVGRDDLTAKAFVWDEALQVRMYRTGDLVRWLPNGDLECLGRKDNQIKINGFRVELGEIEAVIRDSGLVADVVVILATISSKQQLVAACIFKSSAQSSIIAKDSTLGELTVESAENHMEDFCALRERLGLLAYYMVPKTVLPMTRLPLLPSHKVNRKELEAAVQKLGAAELSPYVMETVTDEQEVVPTETPLENALAVMWVDVLNVPATQIGRETNFLSLGGDSVSAIGLASMARQMGYSLPVPTILRTPKLKELAAQMAPLPRSDAPRVRAVFEVPELAKHEATAAGLDWEKDVEYVYPCPPGQVEFLKQGKREEQAWALHTVRRMPSTADQETWKRSTSMLASVDDILRTSWLQVSETEWIGLVLRSTQLDLTCIRCQNEAEAASIIESTWNERFVFGKPFIRYTIITYPDNTWDLITKLDHAVYDGTLLRIFDDHYAAILREQPIPRHTTFKDFAFHIYDLDKSKSLDYWRKRLYKWGESSFLNQAAWANASAPLCNSVVKRSFHRANVDQLATDIGVTPATVFQGAFQIWLSQATASQDVAFDYLLTGRNVDLPDPQTINGTTANFLPMRIDIDSEEGLASFMRRTQDDFWAMTDHGDIGLDQIYEAAGLDRESVGNRVLFIYQPFDPAPSDDPNADFRWLIMAKCRVRMPAPYALVVEVHKAPEKAFALKMSYDSTVLSQDAAGATADEIVKTIEKVIGLSGNAMEKRMGDF